MKESPRHLRGLYLSPLVPQAKAFALDQTCWLPAGRRPVPGGLCLTPQLDWAELEAGWPTVWTCTSASCARANCRQQLPSHLPAPPGSLGRGSWSHRRLMESRRSTQRNWLLGLRFSVRVQIITICFIRLEIKC